MTGLYSAEVRRFAGWAMGLGVLHAAALLLLDRNFPGLRDDGEVVVVASFIYAVVGAAFGFYQAASYARMGHWMMLLHRPLAPWRIMAAISGASATVLVAAVSVPLLLFTGILELQIDRAVDARHWLWAPSAALLALIGLGVGSCLALAPRRYGWALLVAPAVLAITNPGTGAGAMLIPLLLVCVLAFLLAGAFQPDRSRAPSHPGLLMLTAGAVAISFYLVLVGASGLAYQLGLTVVGRNPEVNVPRPGGPVAASRARSRDVLAAGLANSSDPAAAAALAELRDTDAIRLPVALSRLPTRGELTNTGPIAFTDVGRGIKWTYSHDANAFEGLRLADRRPAGELRPAEGFHAPPLLLEDGLAISGGSLYRLEGDEGVPERLVQLPESERIVAVPADTGQHVAILAERVLYLIERGTLGASGAPGSKLAIPLHGLAGDLLRLDLAHVPDRMLISFIYGRDSVDGPRQARQHIVSVTPGGAVRTLAERELRPDYPGILRFRSYWVSPVIPALLAAADRAASSSWTPPRAAVEVPRGVWIGAALLSLLSAVATLFLGMRQGLRPREVTGWTLATLALGAPMLAAFGLVAPLAGRT